MAGFLGSFVHHLDAKGRISLPATFRRGRESEPFVLIQRPTEAVSLYPDEAWLEVEAELRTMAKREAKYRNLLRRVAASAAEVVPDKQGRILIPERIREAVGLGSEALVIGAFNHIEIWDPERFDKSTGGQDETFDEFLESMLF